MNFNSWQYLLFLPIVVLVYFLLPHKVRWAFLLAASYFFYMMWNPWLGILILMTSIISYFAAILIRKDPKRKKLYLIITLVICLGTLFTFKYLTFFLNSIVDLINLFPVHIDHPSISIILPVGISFYTFQTLSYVIDVYRDKFEPERHFGYFALYVSYFPQLVAGPIETPSILLPQLHEKHRFNLEDFSAGMRHILFGFLLKVAIADIVGIYVNRVFASLESAGTVELLVAVILFAFQIYCDFNGYSEIAIGSARLMGVKLTQNFDDPFVATSVTEFFRRWHISLTRWFREYVYIPLGGNRKGKARQCLSILIVFTLCGLWHGANWTFITWGFFAGSFMVLELLFVFPLVKKSYEKGHNPDEGAIGWARRIVTWLLFIPSTILFRSANMAQAGLVFAKLFSGFSANPNDILGFDWVSLLFVIFGAIVMEAAFHYVYRGKKNEDTPSNEQLGNVNYMIKEGTIAVVLILVIASSWIYLVSKQDVSSFAYFQF